MLMVGVAAPAPGKPEPSRRDRGRISVGRGNLLTQAIVLVLHHPTAARAIKHPDALGSVERPGITVLKELLEQAATAAAPTTAVLLERWRDRPEQLRNCQWRSKNCWRSPVRVAEWMNYCKKQVKWA